MLVYFSGSARDMGSVIDDYRLIVQGVQESGMLLVNNWTEVAANRLSLSFDRVKWQEICRDARSGVEDADLLIAEATGSGVFGVGYEVAQALSMNKRVLVLIQKGRLEESYVCGLNHPNLRIEEYERRSLVEIVRRVMTELSAQ